MSKCLWVIEVLFLTINRENYFIYVNVFVCLLFTSRNSNAVKFEGRTIKVPIIIRQIISLAIYQPECTVIHCTGF